MYRKDILTEITKILFLIMLLITLLLSILNVMKWMFETKPQQITTIKIKSIQYDKQTNSQFILGTGSLDNTDYYVCYEILDDGGLVLKKLNAERTIIYETLNENAEAYIELNPNFGKKDKIFVPKNTIKIKYELQK